MFLAGSAKKEGTARPLFSGMKSISPAKIQHWAGESKIYGYLPQQQLVMAYSKTGG